MKQLINRYRITLVFLLLITVIYTNYSFKFRYDLTHDKRFTLSASTKELLREVDSTIKVEVFLTGDLPPDYQKLNIAVKDILAEFNSVASNLIKVEFVKPGENSSNNELKIKLYDSLSKWVWYLKKLQLKVII